MVKVSDLQSIKNIADDVKIIAPLVKKIKKGQIISGISEYDRNKKLIKFDIDLYNT